MKKTLLLLLITVSSLNKTYSQVIIEVQHKYQADMSIYYCEYEYQAQITVCLVDYKYQATKPGNWFYYTSGGEPSGSVKVFTVTNMFEADFRVFKCREPYRVKTTREYLNYINR